LLSIGGTWLQNVALAWLVLQTTNSGAAVGAVSAALFAPSLVVGAWAGSLADRFDARRSLLWLQVVLGGQAAALAIVVFAGYTNFWLLFALAIWNGIGGSVDRPVRQILMNELVGDEILPNAIATNSALVQMGLIGGPALAAVLIDTVGTAWCFVVNAISYVAMFVALAMIRPKEMVHRERVVGTDASVRAGLGHLRTRPDLKLLLWVLMAASVIAYRLDVLMPLIARDLGGGSGLFSALTVVRGVGALLASLFLASRFGQPSVRLMRRALVVFGVSMVALASTHRWLVLVASLPIGAGFMTSMVCTLSLTQLWATPEFRGRLVAVWFVVLSGGIVIGSLVTGWLIDLIGARSTAVAGAMSLLVLVVALRGNVSRGRQPLESG
jgi:MFS family permease